MIRAMILVAAAGLVPPFTLVRSQNEKESRQARVAIVGDQWLINGAVTYAGTQAEGLLMNVRMVNAVFEDQHRPQFDAEANTENFVARIPEYVAHGIRAFTLCLQGGNPGYEGALNSAFNQDGTLREGYLGRVERVIRAAACEGALIILGCYYQRQDQLLINAQAVRTGVINTVIWIKDRGFTNVVLEIANEFGHVGFDHALLKTPEGIAELLKLAKATHPGLLVSASGKGDGKFPKAVAEASDFLLIHFNTTRLEDYSERIQALKIYGKPIICNEDERFGAAGVLAVESCFANRASWGLMTVNPNQRYPFAFNGARDDPVVYPVIRRLSQSSRSGSLSQESTSKTNPATPASDENN